MSATRVIFHFAGDIVYELPIGSGKPLAIPESHPVTTQPSSTEDLLKSKKKDPIVHNRVKGLALHDALQLSDKLNENSLIKGKFPWYVEKVNPSVNMYGLFFNPHLSDDKVVENLKKKHANKLIVNEEGNHEYCPDDKLMKSERDLISPYVSSYFW